jgi:ABC-type multidrug transport system fused ATPase/permease subunit
LFKEKKKLSVAVYLFVSAPSILTEFFAVCLVSMFIWVFVVQLNRPISEILVTIVFIQRIMVNIVTLITNRNSFLADAGSLNNYYYFLDEMKKNKIENVSNSKLSYSKSEYNLEFKNVSFSYEGQPVLQDVSFNLKKGEKVGLVGLSGEGKTTLFDLALGLLKPVKGSILQNGKNLNDLSEKEIARVIGFVPQEPVVFNHGLKENIFWFVPDESKIKNEVLRKGVDTFMRSQLKERDGDMHQGFSGGQKQKIAFFRELLHSPEILFVDEGTSSMDSIAEKEFMDYINSSLHQTSVLMIAHRLSSLKDCDRIIVLSKGQIIEEGSWTELESRRESFFSQLLERQSKDKK